jgi:putative solute:sodium symporter small subunit
MGAQGSLIIYIVLIWIYAKRMRQLDEEYGVEEGED